MSLRLLALNFLVHLEAFVERPRAYLQGLSWLLRGLKVRSRHRFSALAGHTRHAYDLWMEGREPRRLKSIPRSLTTFPVIVVVDCRKNSKGADVSIASAAAMHDSLIHAIILGESNDRFSISLPDTAALAAWLRRFEADNEVKAPWVIAIRAGDRLAVDAIRAYRLAVEAHPDAHLFYADDDLLTNGRRYAPHFKPNWNAELFAHHDFVSNSCMFSCDPARVDADWPRSAMNATDHLPIHVPHVLHHRRDRPAPLIPTSSNDPGEFPHVSVVIPTRDHLPLLRTCILGLNATNYPSFDVTVIDNSSSDPETLAYFSELERSGFRVVRQPGPFNYSALHNAVIPMLRGPLLCLLNNDIEVVDPNWLKILANSAMQDQVGAVGARLLYPDGSIQHAGIVIGIGGGAGHAHRLQRDDQPGYFLRAHLPQFTSAVTAACMVVRKDRFLSVGGFNANDFAVAFNDVDLCLKLNERGWRSFYEARATLIHHESKSRGLDLSKEKKARFAGELAALKRIWNTDKVCDPYHHPELSQFSEQFVVRL